MRRELSRRLARLEGISLTDRNRFTVSDRALTDEEWEASKDGRIIELDECGCLSPILTEAEWHANFCLDAVQRG